MLVVVAMSASPPADNRPAIRDPTSPATDAQRKLLLSLGVDPNAAGDPGMTKGRASAWIDELRARAEPAHDPQRSTRDVPGQRPHVPQETAGFETADRAPGGPAVSVPDGGPDAEADRGPLSPVALWDAKERERHGLAETETAVVRGTKMRVVAELGMPAKYVFARLSHNRRTDKTEVRLFPSIEGLVFRANAYNGGIKRYSAEFVSTDAIPGLGPFLAETKDPQLVARVHVVLGDGTEVTEQGTVRLSEVRLFESQRTGRLVARSPVARTNPMEVAIKRALARALRWGTGFGGTALDELPVPESEEARDQAGLRSGPAALPPGGAP